jgi:osmotically inducible protein OsmC
MFLSALLSNDGHVPNSIKTTAKVHIGQVDGAPTIHTIELNCEADVPGIDDATLQDYAEKAKAGCPVSKALASVGNIQLTATLKS